MTGATEEHLFVPTDAHGVEYYLEEEIHWPLPTDGPGGAIGASGGGAEPSSQPALYSLEGLLNELGERIFLAEVVGPEPVVAAGEPGVFQARSARLVRETAWDLQQAARFALDCAAHVLAEPVQMKLRSGASLEDVLAAAHSWLDRSEGDAGLLGRISRIAAARRLRRKGNEIGDLAFAIVLEDEAEDLDAMEDPDWEAVAAVRDAVLAAVEALRHQALPQLLETENVRYEEDGAVSQPLPEPVDTPWGSFVGGRRAGVVPAWVAARDAASRARDAAGDANGEAAGMEELRWQLGRLRSGLGLGS